MRREYRLQTGMLFGEYLAAVLFLAVLFLFDFGWLVRAGLTVVVLLTLLTNTLKWWYEKVVVDFEGIHVRTFLHREDVRWGEIEKIERVNPFRVKAYAGSSPRRKRRHNKTPKDILVTYRDGCTLRLTDTLLHLTPEGMDNLFLELRAKAEKHG